MSRGILTRGAIKLIYSSVDALFDKIKARFLGPDFLKRFGDKEIYVGYRPGDTLQELYADSAREERAVPHLETIESLAQIASGYLDATNAKTKAKVVATVDRAIRDAERDGMDTDFETLLATELSNVFGAARNDVLKILDTESTHARNLGTMEGISKVNASLGIDDPVVYFVVVRDDSICGECVRLHTLGDEHMTPRVWKMSEVGAGYHHRGDPNPKIGGLHPHCRCSMATLTPGYGFKNGLISFSSFGHDEYARQRG
jgi:hypothetical protein